MMIFSRRPGGYIVDGIRYGAEPVAVTVVKDIEGESAHDALSRRRRRELCETEIAAIEALIERAVSVGSVPAVSIIDQTTEAAEVDRALAEKRAQWEAIDSRVTSAKAAQRQAEAERDEARKLAEDEARKVAEIQDRAASARRELEASERNIGTNKKLEGENKKLMAKVRKLERERDGK